MDPLGKRLVAEKYCPIGKEEHRRRLDTDERYFEFVGLLECLVRCGLIGSSDRQETGFHRCPMESDLLGRLFCERVLASP